MGKVIGVISLKGGVGKTSTVVSLGQAISSFGKKVLLVDGNVTAPNLGLHLKVVDPVVTLNKVLCNKANAGDAIISLGNFDLLPASLFGKDKVSPLKLKDRIKHLKRKYDVILVDSAPTLSEESLAVVLAADELLVVTTPDHPTLSTTIKSIKLAKQRGTPISGLVLNKVHNKNFEIPLKDVEETAEVPVMAVIPHDVKVLKALSEFEPYTANYPKSEGAEEYMKLAGMLIGEQYKPFRVKRFLRKISPKPQDVNRLVFYESVFN